jgi:hydroxyacylglutathione hydrolase
VIRALGASALAAHERAGGWIVDVREPPAFAESHVRGSLNVALSGRSAPYWLNVLTKPGGELAIVTATPAEIRSLPDLLEAADREAKGAIAFDADAFAAAGLELGTIDLITPDRLAAASGLTVLDVREADEWTSGHVPDALWIPLEELPSRVGEVPQGRVATICASGFRSSAAASLLEAAGRTALANVWGGTTAWRQLGLPVRVGRGA